MDVRCLYCSDAIIIKQNSKHVRCERCGGPVQRMQFVKLMQGIHPLGEQHSIVIDNKQCYGIYKSSFGTYVINELTNKFEQLSSSHLRFS
ncbi:hypothetical protein [Chitinophaga caeni]|uniref:hypothetical protein n=1 Tax=Chitinophaga caeni TaxID=2029983 RepID=UPI0012FD9ABE|nr:hypothetical protein [Chitinophaga caeni]